MTVLSLPLTIMGVPAPKGNSRRFFKVRGKPVFAPSAKYTAWLRTCRLQLSAAMAAVGMREPIAVPVIVTAVFYRDARADLDNLCKALGDVLQACGVLKNDRLIKEWHAAVAKPEGCPRVEFEIVEIT